MTTSPTSPSPAAAVAGVVFDVDGTLLAGSGANLDAMAEAARTVLGLDVPLSAPGEVPTVGDRPVPGWVDGQLMDHLVRLAGHDPAVVGEEFLAAYVDCYRAALADGADPGRLLPGVRELLERLRANGVPVGLATGNVAAVAEAKMAAHGIAEFFTFDPALGFGDRRLSRAEVGLDAVPALGAVDNAYLVGDTIGDMWSAQLNDARGIGVLTGAASARELHAAGAWAVLPDAAALGELLFLPL